MLLLNFSHPLTTEQLAQVGALTGHPADRVVDVPVPFNPAQSFMAQVIALVESVGLTAIEWQTLPLLINPPGHAPLAVTLLAELHGRMGYFPAVLRLRPVPVLRAWFPHEIRAVRQAINRALQALGQPGLPHPKPYTTSMG